ncbi:MAG: hypothetical protein ACRDWW_10115 [Acidimicrobiales bacterium]
MKLFKRDGDEADRGPSKANKIQAAFSRVVMGIPLVRRWYVRRILKYIDKSKAKGRRLPENMMETAKFLARVPRGQREKALEEAFLANQQIPQMGREYRRAAERQRLSGKGPGRRPGLPPEARKQISRQRPPAR